MKSGNDPVFVDADRLNLARSVDDFLGQDGEAAHDPALLQRLSYRPFDLRWFYNDLALLNRPGPLLQRVWARITSPSTPYQTARERVQRSGATASYPTTTPSGAATAAMPSRCTTGGPKWRAPISPSR